MGTDRYAEMLFIDGAFERASDEATRSVLEKATGRVLGTVAEASAADVDRAVRGAVGAQERWSRTSPGDRAAVLRRTAGLLIDERERLVDLLIREAGSTRSKAEGEVSSCVDELYQVCGLPFEAMGSILPSADSGRTNVLERRPVGVVGLITAWNYPMDIAFRVLAAALALGNAVVVKPAPTTPLSGGLAWVELLTRAGVPDGLVQIVPGDAAGPALVSHPDVDLIHFTGSSTTGRIIAMEAAKSLKKVALEMGGNNPALILADADLDHAVAQVAAASFVHQGQVCVATSRHIVVAAVADEYLARLVDIASGLRVGDPATAEVDIGPVVDENQASRADDLVRSSVEAGARIVTGGGRDGLFFQPTVVDAVRPGMALFEQEIFAPIAPVTIATDVEEALLLANATPYGLSASIFTSDVGRGWELARRVRAGMVHVNEMSALRENHVPFAGIGSSGFGQAFGGRANIELLTEQRWISLHPNGSTTSSAS